MGFCETRHCLYFTPKPATMYTETNVPDPTSSIFSDEDIFHYQEASVRQRFLNCLIDNLVIRFTISYLTAFALGFLLASLNPDFLSIFSEKGPVYYVVILGLGYLNYLIYYTVCESAFKGYTLGKLITGTKAVCEDGQELSFKHALLRSLCRVVPFEAFTGFSGQPWHDKWTRTMVVKTRM